MIGSGWLPTFFVIGVVAGFSMGVGADYACKVEPCAPTIMFEEKAIEPALTIDPRGVIWYKGKRADQLTDEELLEVVELLMEVIRGK